jgi:hypothetical protein
VLLFPRARSSFPKAEGVSLLGAIARQTFLQTAKRIGRSISLCGSAAARRDRRALCHWRDGRSRRQRKCLGRIGLQADRHLSPLAKCPIRDLESDRPRYRGKSHRHASASVRDLDCDPSRIHATQYPLWEIEPAGRSRSSTVAMDSLAFRQPDRLIIVISGLSIARGIALVRRCDSY